jgi:hypothetical protein
LSERELWLIGIALYWAEGSKQNTRSPSTGIQFGNTDPQMLRVFMAWLKNQGISNDFIIFEIYIHQDRIEETPYFLDWWRRELLLPSDHHFRRYTKKGNPKTKRSNVGDLYHGLVRIRVRSSTVLNRQVHGWVKGIDAAVGNGVIGNTPTFGVGDSRIVP